MSDPARQAADKPAIIFNEAYTEVALIFPTKTGGQVSIGMVLPIFLTTVSDLTQAAVLAEYEQLTRAGHFPSVSLRVVTAAVTTDAAERRILMRMTGDTGAILTHGLSADQAESLGQELLQAADVLRQRDARPLQ